MSAYVWIVIAVIVIIIVIVAIIVYFSTRPTTNSNTDKNINTSLVTIINQFEFPIWVEAKYGNNGIPIPPAGNLYLDNTTLTTYANNTDAQNYWKSAITTVEIPPGMNVGYNVDPGGLAGARFWAKFSCSPCGANGKYASSPALCLPPYPVSCSNTGNCAFKGAGTNCIIGDSSQYYVPPTSTNSGGGVGGCPSGGCSVPIDSLFEATFGCTNNNCNPNPSGPGNLGPNTYFDTSQVDGYTFPYLVVITGNIDGCVNTNTGQTMQQTTALINGKNTTVAYIDGRGLVMDYDGSVGCPNNADLSYKNVTSVTDTSLTPPVTYDLTKVDLGLYLDTSTQKITFNPTDSKVGCMSSCKKLNYGQPYGMNQAEGCIPTIAYCCPTTIVNNTCSGVNPGCVNGTTNAAGLTGCVTSSQCSNGPVATSAYVQSVHTMAPGVYAYAYDDKEGLYSCGNNVQYYVIFGPDNANSTTYWNSIWNSLGN